MADAVDAYVRSIEWIRELLEPMDALADPVMGVRDWDDAVCVGFEGGLLASSDGPYTKRLVLKSALVHAATDVVVKGGRTRVFFELPPYKLCILNIISQ